MEKTTKGKAFKIIRNVERCYGCRTCELACSFHHKRVFAPELSSIRITKSNRTGIIRWRMDSSCDLCLEEDQPLCVKYCSYGALQVGGGL